MSKQVDRSSACIAIVTLEPSNVEKCFRKLIHYAFKNKLVRLDISIYSPWPFSEWIPLMREGISENLHITLIVRSYNDIESTLNKAIQCTYKNKVLVCDSNSLNKLRKDFKNLIDIFEILGV